MKQSKFNVKLIYKVKRLVKRAGMPRWLHHFGPKKYEFWNHAIAYIVKQECKLGYRRVSRLLRWLGFKTPCPSAICMSFKKLPLPLWQRLLQATINSKTYIVAIDGTGISRPLPSPYYYRRIDKPYPIEIPLKLSIAIDTKTKKILALRFRAKRAHDIKDVKYLLNRLPYNPIKLVADKAYDANWLHKLCEEKGIITCIPKRNYGKDSHYRKTATKRAAKNFNKRTYGRREMAEAVFSAIKRKFGASVSSTTYTAQRAELYSRAIAHNIINLIQRLFERSPRRRKIYKTYMFCRGCKW